MGERCAGKGLGIVFKEGWGCFVLVLAWCLGMSGVLAAESSRRWERTPYVIKTWQTEDGLPENSATAMVQTRDGYLWFGTFNGLVRFDGVRFEVWNRVNTPELPSEGIVSLHLDRHDRLWVSTLRGLVVREGNQWRRVALPTPDESEFVRTFSERPNGDLLLTLVQGTILEYSGGRLTQLPSPPGEPNMGYFGGCAEDGRWWVAQRTFVGTWEGTQWQAVQSVTNIPGPAKSAFGMAPARNGGLWLLVANQLQKIVNGRPVTTVVIPDDPQDTLGSISQITEDSAGTIWIATFDAGLTQILLDGTVRRWNQANGLAYKDVRFVFEDREKNLWIGTSGGGLQRFRPRRFQAYGYTEGGGARLVYSVSGGPDGSVWAGTFGQGLFRWSPEAGFGRFHPPSWAKNNLHFTSVLADRKGRTWVGVYDDGLIVFGASEDRHFQPSEIGGPTVASLFEDSRGRIWISAGSGLAVYDEGRITLLGTKEGLPAGTVGALSEGPAGTIWVANQGGVFQWREGRFEELKSGSAVQGVMSLKNDTDGTLWMGTRDQGLLRWRDGVWSTLDESVGLPVRGIYGILEDASGYFWMASNRGVMRVSRRQLTEVAEGILPTLSGQLLDLGDGLPSVECAAQGQPVCARDINGNLWFATTKGVAVTNPEEFEANPVPPPVVIEALDYVVPSRHRTSEGFEPRRITAPFPQPLELPAGSREIAIHYTANSFATPEKVHFQVKLAGDDSGWRRGVGSRVERLYELRPRPYEFHVRAANNDGVWNETGTQLAFTVLPFYWQTWWFRLSFALLLVGSGALAAGMYSRSRVLRALEREQAAVEIQGLREKLAHSNRVSSMGQLASALAHELSQPLGAILRNAEAGELLLGQSRPDLTEVRAILGDIREDDQRAAGVIDRMRGLLKQGRVERLPLALPDLVQEVVALTRREALQRKIQVQTEVPSDLPLVPGDRIQIQQVLLNLVLNSMDAMNEVPPERRVLVIQARRTQETMVEVSVRDSGPGIPEANLSKVFEPFFSTKQNGMGIGLMICRTIVESHGGSLRAENNSGPGACFTFSLPGAETVESVARRS